ncbi:two-component system sensor histidine kinase NtrB [Rubinisphaera margarita]|uniref:two-component system sensor histidine kinase NtrB n=1 Tax=Rubinisphaera margarita TaxID=2909586 RepID=UPI001EE94BF7|nr:ATP-binding protein [Rubinisphaera margarita]MCG6156468.1 ATP-binding protein [Rubinisphaera margarita]
MFDVKDGSLTNNARLFALGLVLLSVSALGLTAWILWDVQQEQEIVSRIIQHLPESDLEAARELSGDLKLQSRLSILLVLNITGTAIAFALMLRGYLSSERSLRDVKVLATDILASMDAGVITTDSAGRITSINPRGRELIGMENGTLGQALSEIAPDHGLLHLICTEVNQEHNCVRDRDYNVNNHGHRKTLRAGCTLLRNQRDEEIGTVLHVRDVTQKALLEERLRRMERFIGLGSLAAGLHHEIKNPLSALSLHIQLLSEQLATQQTDPEIQESLDVLHTEVKRINEVLDGFRNYAAMTALGRAPVEIWALIVKLVRLLRPQANSQDVQIELDLAVVDPPTVQADSVQLEQVLLNLALNGLAAMPEGGTLTFRLSLQEDFVRIDVSDTGHGVPTEIAHEIFDPYFTTRREGTGMGLALCDKIVRQHGGTIEFHSRNLSPGQPGTEFTVLIPLDGKL